MGRIGLDLMSKTLTLDAYSLDFSKGMEISRKRSRSFST